jgi:hypothetical protein
MKMNNQIENAIQYNTNEEPIVISKPTSDKLLRLEHPGDAMALYWFYYYTAKWQHTNSPHANNLYTQEGLHWTKKRLARAKGDLIELGLIETIRTRDVNTKTFNSPLLKINFIWWNRDKIEAIGYKKPYDTKSHRMANVPSKGNTVIGEKDLTVSPATVGPDDACFLQLAIHLSKVVLSHRKIATSSQMIKAWAREIRKVHTVAKVPLADIQAAMKWYVNNAYSSRFVPIIECGMTFRDKYAKLLAAIERDNEQFVSSLQASQHTGAPQTLDSLEVQQLQQLVVQQLGSAAADTGRLDRQVREIKSFYDHMMVGVIAFTESENVFFRSINSPGTFRHPWNCTWPKFFGLWLQFLRDKPPSYKPRSLYDLDVGKPRWVEFVSYHEQGSGYNLTTGHRLPGDN